MSRRTRGPEGSLDGAPEPEDVVDDDSLDDDSLDGDSLDGEGLLKLGSC